MSYFDKIYVLDHMKEIVSSSNYNSPYIYLRSTRIPHPQRKKAECLKVTLLNTDKVNLPNNSINLYVDDYEIIKVTTTRDYPLFETEEKCFHDRFYVNFLKSYMKKQFELHGEQYLSGAKAVREKNKVLLESAKLHTIRLRENLMQTIATSDFKESQNMLQIKKDLKYYGEIIDCLESNIKNQENILDYISSFEKAGQDSTKENIF